MVTKYESESISEKKNIYKIVNFKHLIIMEDT